MFFNNKMTHQQPKISVPCSLSQTCALCHTNFTNARKRKYCPGECAKEAALKRVREWNAANREYSNEKNRRRRAAARVTKEKKTLTSKKTDDHLSAVQQHVCGEGGVDESVPGLLPSQHEEVQHVPEGVLSC